MNRSHLQTSPLDLHVSFWMRSVSNQVSHALGLTMQAHGVTVAEWSVLRLLYDGKARPVDLATRLGMTRSAISKLAERLTAKALITRDVTEGDLRSQSLMLTGDGRALVPVLAQLADDNDERFFGHLGLEHRETMRLLMRNITARMQVKKRA